MQSKPAHPAARVALLGLLFALALVLSLLEGLLPGIPGLPAGIKPGLSNIITMYALFFLDGAAGLVIACLKSLFVLLTRGPVAASLSLAGGLLSVGAMLLAMRRFPGASVLALSVLGALCHNLGQFAMAGVLLRTRALWVYLPLLLAAGAGMGALTGALLAMLLPALSRLRLHVEQRRPPR